jgi:hypothetical protein
MPIFMPKPKPVEDNSAWGSGLLKGLVNVAGLALSPYTGGASLVAAQGVNAAGDAAHEQKLKGDVQDAQCKDPGQGLQAQNSESISRRYQQEMSQPVNQLAQAESALAKMPPDIQEQYGPTISQARMRAMKGQV